MHSKTRHTLFLFGIVELVAYILVMLGSHDWIGRMVTWLFYKDWIVPTLSAFLVILYFDWVNRKLNGHFPWIENWKGRLSKQVVDQDVSGSLDLIQIN